MPLRAFIDSDKYPVLIVIASYEFVLMPLRAFIDSDLTLTAALFSGFVCVLMPLRAFIDSDFLDGNSTVHHYFVGLNALTGIY